MIISTSRASAFVLCALLVVTQTHAAVRVWRGGFAESLNKAAGKKNMGGDGVLLDNNMGAAAKGGGGGKGKTPSFMLPLASPLNKPEVTYIPPWAFGNEKWDPVAGGATPFGPSPDFVNSKLKPGQSVPFPPGTPPDQNPNLYIQPPPLGVSPSEIQIAEDAIVNRVKRPRKIGPQGALNGIPVYSRQVGGDMMPPGIVQIPPRGVSLNVDMPGTFLQEEQTTSDSGFHAFQECQNCVFE